MKLRDEVELRLKRNAAYLRYPASQKDEEFKVEYETASSAGAEVFKIGKGVSPPDVIKQVEPNYPREARKAKLEGVVVLSAVVDTNGRAINIHVLRSLRQDLDENAVDALSKWTFKPAMKDGHPVAVACNFEINFRPY